MSAALTNKQKGYLAQLAGEAFGKLQMADGKLQTVEEWRHEQVAEACGKAGLRCCSQEDYSTVKGHFLALLGRHKAAFNAHVRSATEGKRIAEWKLKEACEEAGVRWEYAESICRAQNHGSAVADVSEKRVWFLVFTIRNRKKSNHRGTEAQRKEVEEPF